MEMTPRVKTVSNLPLRFPIVVILGGAFPVPITSRRDKRRYLSMGMTPRLIIVSSFPVVFPDYGMIDTNILGGAFRF